MKKYGIIALLLGITAYAGNSRLLYTDQLHGMSTVTIYNNLQPLALPTSADTLVGRSTVDVLTNKSIDGLTNTITNVPGSGILPPFPRSTIATGTSSYVLINDASGYVSEEAALASTRGGTGVANTGNLTYGPSTYTFTSSGPVSVTYPTSGTLATLAGSEVLTNKTIALGSNNVTGNANSIVITDGSGVVTTSSVLQPGNGGTGVANGGNFTYGSNNLSLTTSGSTSLTLPTSGTVATLAGSEVLTNKTMDIGSNTFTGNANSVVITNGAGTVATSTVLPIGNGGTASTTALGGFNALSPLSTKGQILTHDGSNNVALPISTDGYVLTLNSGASNGVDWEAAPGATANDQSYELNNLGLSSVVASNIMTVNVLTKTGATPSGGSPVYVGFRSGDSTVGLYNVRSVASSLGLSTVAVGASFGTSSASEQPIYVYAIDNAGTVELALAGSQSFDEGKLHTTTAMSGSATSGNVLYSASARTNVPIRLVGRVKVTEATAGTYATAPSEISVTPLVSNAVPRSSVMVTTANGHGSSNTKIAKYSGIFENSGTAITYTSSSTNGDSFTINETGVYSITSIFISDSGTISGISRNSTQLTTDIYSITGSDALAYADESAGFTTAVVWTGILKSGDIIRVHDRGAAISSNQDRARFTITKVSN